MIFNQELELILFFLAALRVLLEFTSIDLSSLPMNKLIFKNEQDLAKKFHRMGFYFSCVQMISSGSLLFFRFSASNIFWNSSW